MSLKNPELSVIQGNPDASNDLGNPCGHLVYRGQLREGDNFPNIAQLVERLTVEDTAAIRRSPVRIRLFGIFLSSSPIHTECALLFCGLFVMSVII